MVSDPAIRMNGLYPGPATAPGWNLASRNPSGPGAAMRVGLKSGAPAKLMTAGPKWLSAGDGLIRWTVCTHAGQEIPMLASLGAKFTPRSSAAPEVEASSRMYQTFSSCEVPAYAIPGYSGSRTVSLLRSTWMALSRVRWSRGSRPGRWPSPVDSPGPWSARTAGAGEAGLPGPAGSASDVLTAASAASTAISPRLDA